MAGRFDDSRMANCIPSKAQPCATQWFTTDSNASSVTELVSTIL
jgi:hypothetical protein